MLFSDLSLDDRLLEGIDFLGFTNATPIQEQVMPHIMAGRDVLACAQTGTGKTAAFLLPVINALLSGKRHDHHISCLIIVPTRELALQIAQTLEGLSYFTDLSGIAVYGGGDGPTYANEQKALSKGVDIVVCTPGRMISHLNMGQVKIKQVHYLILDEADRMLDMGFNEDITKIISHLPVQRQNLLFSATMPKRIRELAQTLLKDPVEINLSISKPPEKIKQEAFVVYPTQKLPLLKLLLKSFTYHSIIIFCSKKEQVKDITRALKQARFAADEIHSDLDQGVREQILRNFKNKETRMLVATDILARGIDIEDIDLVVNYDVPKDGEDYVHRIGRTARAASDGNAWTFVTEKEFVRFSSIEDLLGYQVAKSVVPSELGEVPAYVVPSKTRKKFTTTHKKPSNKRRFHRPKKKSTNNSSSPT